MNHVQNNKRAFVVECTFNIEIKNSWEFQGCSPDSYTSPV